MVARKWLEHCAADEWGNETMQRIAQERFAKDDTLDVVEVYEHAGWYLAWNRAGNVVGTANDMAVLSIAAREFIRQFSECRLVGYTRRPEADVMFDNYYPCLVAEVA